MKLLNIDNLIVPEMAIEFQGVEYPIEEPDVGTFLRLTAEEARLRAADGRTSVIESIELIKRVIPSMPAEILERMKFPQLYAVLAFINGQVDELGNPVKAAEAIAEAEGAEPGKE